MAAGICKVCDADLIDGECPECQITARSDVFNPRNRIHNFPDRFAGAVADLGEWGKFGLTAPKPSGKGKLLSKSQHTGAREFELLASGKAIGRVIRFGSGEHEA